MGRALGHRTGLGVATSHRRTGVQTPTDPCRLCFTDHWGSPMPPPDGVSRPAGRGTEPRGGEAGQSERRPGRGRLGPPTRRDPTRQGASVRLVLTGEPSSRVRRFGDVRRCSRASHGLKTTARPRGPTATGTPWKRMDDGGKSVSRAPPRTTPGGRSQTSSSGWCEPRPPHAWRADARRRQTRANTPQGSLAWCTPLLKPGGSCFKRAGAGRGTSPNLSDGSTSPKTRASQDLEGYRPEGTG